MNDEGMATVSINITRPGGLNMTAGARVPDAMVIDMAGMIGAMIFDASYADPVADPAAGGGLVTFP